RATPCHIQNILQLNEMVDTETVSTIIGLGVKIFNPFHCLCVGDLAQVLVDSRMPKLHRW
ncbi:MAG: hypothetical protein PVG35_12925, partial [Desulfobacterales bacterium]